MKSIKALVIIFLNTGIVTTIAAQGLDDLRAFLSKAKSEDSMDVTSRYFESIQNDDPSELAETYAIWGEYMQENRSYDSARSLFQQSIILYEKIGNKSALADAKLELADIYANEDNRVASQQLSHEAYDIYVGLGDSLKIYYALMNIAINHDYLDDHKIAIKYYEECVEICKNVGHTLGEASAYHNLGGIYADEGDHQLALDYYDKSRKISEDHNDYDGLWGVYQGLYLTYKRMELKSEAYTNLKKEHYFAKLDEDQVGIAFSYQDHGTYHLMMGNYDSSIYYSTKALALANDLNMAQIVTNAYEGLRKAYYAKGDYKKAFDFYAKEVAKNDSLYNIENSRLIESIKTQFETEKKEHQLAEKNLQLQAADYDLKRHKTIMTILFLVLGSLAVIIFLIYRGYMLRKKANEALTVKNEEIALQNEKIKAVDEMKNRWFINVAHELRTPLTLIKGPVQKILTSESLTPQVEEDLELVYKNTQNLVKLINEILDLSKLEDGEMLLQVQVVDINILVKQVISIFESKAKESEVKLEWGDTDQGYMEIDPDKVSKVLVNLISNALRFTNPGGSISISLCVEETVNIKVKDTGVGIDPEDLEHVFDRFYQASTNKNAGGTGVGLALSKEIAQLHGGDLTATSQVGQGTEFTLSMPKSILATKPKSAPETVDLSEALEDNFVSTNVLSRLSEKPTLLIVEDNVDMRRYIKGLMKPYFEIKEAGNGLEGLKSLENNQINVIICDMMMPEMDGLQFSKKVKSNEEWKNIPFIHLSAINEGITRKEALMVGVDDYLQKPFDPEELIIRVRNLFQNSLARMEVVPEEEESISFEDKVLKNLRDEVMQNIADSNFSVARLADCAAMSERQIYRYLKNTTGLTPLQFIQEIKLNKAMDLAQKRVYMSSSELAAAVGFQHSPYFSSLFERRFGKKPSAYLKTG
ncbi:MAG: ATP-binding protein [Cyclobacteriaceae bacterium]